MEILAGFASGAIPFQPITTISGFNRSSFTATIIGMSLRLIQLFAVGYLPLLLYVPIHNRNEFGIGLSGVRLPFAIPIDLGFQDGRLGHLFQKDDCLLVPGD